MGGAFSLLVIRACALYRGSSHNSCPHFPRPSPVPVYIYVYIIYICVCVYVFVCRSDLRVAVERAAVLALNGQSGIDIRALDLGAARPSLSPQVGDSHKICILSEMPQRGESGGVGVVFKQCVENKTLEAVSLHRRPASRITHTLHLQKMQHCLVAGVDASATQGELCLCCLCLTETASVSASGLRRRSAGAVKSPRASECNNVSLHNETTQVH